MINRTNVIAKAAAEPSNGPTWVEKSVGFMDKRKDEADSGILLQLGIRVIISAGDRSTGKMERVAAGLDFVQSAERTRRKGEAAKDFVQ